MDCCIEGPWCESLIFCFFLSQPIIRSENHCTVLALGVCQIQHVFISQSNVCTSRLYEKNKGRGKISEDKRLRLGCIAPDALLHAYSLSRAPSCAILHYCVLDFCASCCQCTGPCIHFAKMTMRCVCFTIVSFEKRFRMPVLLMLVAWEIDANHTTRMHIYVLSRY